MGECFASTSPLEIDLKWICSIAKNVLVYAEVLQNPSRVGLVQLSLAVARFGVRKEPSPKSHWPRSVRTACSPLWHRTQFILQDRLGTFTPKISLCYSWQQPLVSLIFWRCLVLPFAPGTSVFCGKLGNILQLAMGSSKGGWNGIDAL